MPRREENPEIEQTRLAMIDLLLSKVKEDRFPSASMLDLLEQMLTTEELPAYASVLMEKIAGDTYPSASMMKRLVTLST
jgi:hypothetical protein